MKTITTLMLSVLLLACSAPCADLHVGQTLAEWKRQIESPEPDGSSPGLQYDHVGPTASNPNLAAAKSRQADFEGGGRREQQL